MDPTAGTGAAYFNVMLMAITLMMIAYPVYRVISMLVDKSIEVTEAVIYMGVLAGFIGGIMTSWGTPVGWLLMVMLAVLCLSYQFIQQTAERRLVAQMDKDDLAECEQIITSHPTNAWAYERATDICRRRGDYQGGAEYAERYLATVGSDTKMEMRLKRFKSLIRQRETGVKVCPECHTENYPGASVCIKCGRSLALPGDFLAGCATDTGIRALAATGITLMLAGIVLAVAGGNTVLVGLLFTGAFVASVAYLYLRR
jgi:ribosomal protein L40E